MISQKVRNKLLALFAVSPIMKKWALPGMVGIILAGFGAWRRLVWLEIAGFVFAAPILWVYIVIIFVYFPLFLVDKIRRH